MAPSEPRRPQVTLVLNGAVSCPVESASIICDSHLGADRFHATFPLTGSAAIIQSGLPAEVDIQATLGAEWTSLISGQVDCISIDPIHKSVRVEGRDFTSRLLNSQTQDTFENRTSSQIVNAIAARNGMTASAAATSTLVGRYFGNGRTRLALYQHARATSDWDILVWLAQIEGFDIWVDHLTLNFQPKAQPVQAITIDPSNCVAFSMRRRLDIAAGISVQVNSWNCQMQQSVVQTATSPMSTSPGVALQVVRPNLSSQDASTMAQRLMAEMAAHEYEIGYTMAADLTTLPRARIQVINGIPGFGGLYEICEVEREFNSSRGLLQHVRAKSWISS